MSTLRTTDEDCSPSDSVDSIRGWRSSRYAAIVAVRHAAATLSLRNPLRRTREFGIASSSHLVASADCTGMEQPASGLLPVEARPGGAATVHPHPVDARGQL